MNELYKCLKKNGRKKKDNDDKKDENKNDDKKDENKNDDKKKWE